MASPASLLVTKLYAPPPQPGRIPRPRLIEQLNADLWREGGFARKLTVASAPAGFGKTTLIVEWLRSVDHRFTWLSLDDNDNDPARFLAYLIAALQKIDAAIGHSTQAMLQSPQPPPPEVLLTLLVNELASVSSPFVVVLDDYHLINALPIHQQLAFLLEHQPPQMNLIIITREDPPLPLSRLRARGQVAEIRQSDLQFTLEETADFLRQVTPAELARADIAALQRRTEGWIAGLQLFALSLRGHDNIHQLIESFTGSDRYILDYLVDEVFKHQSADVQDFLLQTSILDRLTAPLCDAVTDRNNSRDVLRALEHANLFIVPLDQAREWYRYHHLFAELLQHHLRVEDRHDVAQLHRRASQRHADRDFSTEAIRHALQGAA